MCFIPVFRTTKMWILLAPEKVGFFFPLLCSFHNHSKKNPVSLHLIHRLASFLFQVGVPPDLTESLQTLVSPSCATMQTATHIGTDSAHVCSLHWWFLYPSIWKAAVQTQLFFPKHQKDERIFKIFFNPNNCMSLWSSIRCNLAFQQVSRFICFLAFEFPALGIYLFYFDLLSSP